MHKKNETLAPDGFFVPETDLYKHMTHFGWVEIGDEKKCWVLEKPGVGVVRLKKPEPIRIESPEGRENAPR